MYGADLPSTFYRKDISLSPAERYYDGAPPAVMRFGAAWPGANFELIDKTTEIAPGIHLIALVSDKPGTLELRELSLAINTPEGMVIVVGCSHPGIDKIVAAVAAINARIHFIAGGFHLVVSNDEEIEKIVATLHDTFKVAFVAPGHCTGEPTFTALKKAFGDWYLYAGLGTTFALGANPRAIAGSRPRTSTAMDDDDLEELPYGPAVVSAPETLGPTRRCRRRAAMMNSLSNSCGRTARGSSRKRVHTVVD